MIDEREIVGLVGGAEVDAGTAFQGGEEGRGRPSDGKRRKEVRNNSISNHRNQHDKHHMNQKHQIQNSHSSQPRVLELAVGLEIEGLDGGGGGGDRVLQEENGEPSAKKRLGRRGRREEGESERADKNAPFHTQISLHLSSPKGSGTEKQRVMDRQDGKAAKGNQLYEVKEMR
nr:hypothetical protein CFP56_48447 [Quercus suber]